MSAASDRGIKALTERLYRTTVARRINPKLVKPFSCAASSLIVVGAYVGRHKSSALSQWASFGREAVGFQGSLSVLGDL